MPAARIQMPGVQDDPLIASLHVYSPIGDDENAVDYWANVMASDKAQLRQLRHRGPPSGRDHRK